MKTLFILLAIGIGVNFSASAQQACLTADAIKNLDAKWEQTQLNANVEFLQSLLGENFIWVHNHASLIDDKAAVLKRAANQIANGSSDTRSRVSSDVVVSITGKTAVVTGITIVDRGPTPTKYHFMRTYTEINGKCMLLANHTMAIPEED